MTPKSYRWGYVRVSTDRQSAAMQLQALNLVECDRIVEETASGNRRHDQRPELAAMLKALRPGDEIVVYRIDRLARSLSDLLDITRQIHRAGATLRSTSEPIGGGGASAELLISLLGAFASYERSILVERTHEGLRAAKARGTKLGRKSKIDAAALRVIAKADRARLLDDPGQRRDLAKSLGISQSTLYRALKRVPTRQIDKE